MKNIIKKQSGITLIALVITIVVLIILAGVAINLTLSQNGIFNKATQAREKYSAAEAKERLEQEILNIQIEAVKEGKEFSLKYLNEKLDKTKYEIILDDEENPTIAVIKEINSNFYLTVDSELNIIKVEEKEPKPQYIKFGEVTWENGKASITLTTKENGTIEYKVGENGVYVAGTTISNLNNGDMVYARINNNGIFTDEQTIKIEDTIKPEEFTIETSNITAESVQLTGITTDNQTGIKDYTYVVATGDTIVKEIKNQTATSCRMTGLESETEYVVYMLAYDNAGNVRKSNEEIVTTPKAPINIYVKLYTDGTLAFSSTNIILSNKKIEKNFGDVGEKKWFDWTSNQYREKVKIVNFVDKIHPISCDLWFYGQKNLTNIQNISNFDTSKITNMDSLFFECEKLDVIDLSHFNTANVTNMNRMFYGCKSLKSLNLSSFNTTNVTQMDGMFQNCENLTKLDLSHFNTVNVTRMQNMFYNCFSLPELKLSNFETRNLQLFVRMFSGCSNLTTLDLTSFTTLETMQTDGLFQDCSKLSNIKVSDKWKIIWYASTTFKNCAVKTVTFE